MPDQPIRVDASLAEEALAALADDDEDRCEECGEIGTENGTYCYPCLEGLTNEGSLDCPFCQKSSSDHCAHLVLGQDSSGDWVFVPADEADLPRLDDGASADAWGDGEIQAVFGELGLLVEAYETPSSEPDPGDFYTRLAALMSTTVVVRDGIGVMALYFEHHRDEARAEVEAIIRKVAEGFERLAVYRGHAVDDSAAEDAIAALAGRECKHGGGSIDPTTFECGNMGDVHCPFCDDTWCSAHEVAQWDDNNGYIGPDVPFPRRWLGAVEVWSDERKHIAFGDLEEVAKLYASIGEEGERQDIVAFYVVEHLAGRLTGPVVRVGWTAEGLAAGEGEILFARNSGQAESELTALLDRLRQGFERLAARRRSPCGGPADA
jgi:hypothetical protein